MKNVEPLPIVIEQGGSTLFYHADIACLMILRWQQMQAENTDIRRKVSSDEQDSGRTTSRLAEIEAA